MFSLTSSERQNNPFRDPNPFESAIEALRSLATWLSITGRRILPREKTLLILPPVVARTLALFGRDDGAPQGLSSRGALPDASPPASPQAQILLQETQACAGPSFASDALTGAVHTPADRLGHVGAARLLVVLNGVEHSVPLPGLEGPTCPTLRLAATALARSGGSRATSVRVQMARAQIQLHGVENVLAAWDRISALSAELLQRGVEALGDRPVPIGRFPSLQLHGAGTNSLLVSLEAETGASIPLVSLFARAIAPVLIQLVEPRLPPRVVLGISQREVLQVTCCIKPSTLFEASPWPSVARQGSDRRRLLRSLSSDEHDPQRATRDNDEVTARMSEACRSLHLDRDTFERAARAHAKRWGSCEPLVRWRVSGHGLRGQLTLPICPMTRISCARDGADEQNLLVVGSVGLLASLAGIIQRLSARSGVSASSKKRQPRRSQLGPASSTIPARFLAPDESGVRPALGKAPAIAN